MNAGDSDLLLPCLHKLFSRESGNNSIVPLIGTELLMDQIATESIVEGDTSVSLLSFGAAIRPYDIYHVQ